MQWLFFGNETISLTSQFDNDKSKEPNSTSGHDQKEEKEACWGSKGLDLFWPVRFVAEALFARPKRSWLLLEATLKIEQGHISKAPRPD